MMALMAPVLVGFTALTVDVGRLYVRKQALSNAVDAAALAGGRELPSEAAAAAEARRVAAANQIDVSRVTTEIQYRAVTAGAPGSGSPSSNYLKVTATEDVPMTFARIFGINEWPLSARAAVAVTGSTNTPNAVPNGSTPFGVDKTAINSSGKVNVIVSSCSFQQFWVLPQGTAGTDLDNIIRNGYPNSMGVGDVLNVGNPKNPNYWYQVLGGIEDRIRRAESNPIYSAQTAGTATAANPRVVIIPIVEAVDDPIDHKNTSQVRIVAFAAMYILNPIRVEQPAGQGRQFWLDGKLIDIVTPDATYDPGRPPADPTIATRLARYGGELEPLKLRLVE
jgi:hypothetical protein